MADPRMKELAYEALLTSFSRPNLGFEGITEIEQYAGSPALPSPTQEFTRAIPSITPFEPTMRQRLSSGAQTGLEFFGMRRPQARSVSQAIFGGPSSPIPANLGIADVVPFLGTALQTEEAAESLGRAGQLAREGEYGQAAMQAGAGVLGLVPGAVGTARVAAPLVRQARTTPPVGAIGPIDVARQMAPRSPIGFYSAVEETVVNLPQTKGTGDQFLAQISKTPGVKPEEIKWTGLDEFLKGRKSVTKAEVQDYLAANRVDVQEVRLGEISPEQSLAISQAKNRYREITDAVADTRQKVEEGLLSSQEARAILEPLNAERSRLDNQILSNAAPATKFSRYTLPGGENYREILLTLPFKEPAMPKGYNVRSVQYDDGSFRYFAETPTTRSAAYKTEEDAQAELQRMASSLKDWRASQESYRSTHYDQPNILAHMRVNDRVVDGKKTLFIEEIQSDWHQAGRKKGYRGDVLGEKVSDAEYKLAADLQRRQNILGETLTPEESRQLNEILTRHTQSLPGAQVPNAPFKTTWHELSLKRAIQEASEKGYDQIAFTTGKTQAARYDLSKQVDYIDYRKSPDGTFELGIADITGNTVDLPKVRYTADELPDLVGKEVADKIVSGQGQPGGGRMTLRGVDLQVGGEGMKGFYDNILPKSLEKLGKKFDAKVGKTEMDGVEVWRMDITPKMRESAKGKGQPLFQVLPPAAAVGAMQEEEEVQ